MVFPQNCACSPILLSDKGKFGMFAYYCWVVGLGSLIAGIIVPLFSK